MQVNVDIGVHSHPHFKCISILAPLPCNLRKQVSVQLSADDVNSWPQAGGQHLAADYSRLSSHVTCLPSSSKAHLVPFRPLLSQRLATGL